MNPVSAIQSAMSAPIEPFEPADVVRAQVAVAISAKVLHIQAAMGAEVVKLLDPSRGQHLDRRA